MYPAALGLSPADRPPPFALMRSFFSARLYSGAPSRLPPGGLRTAFASLKVGKVEFYARDLARKTAF